MVINALDHTTTDKTIAPTKQKPRAKGKAKAKAKAETEAEPETQVNP